MGPLLLGLGVLAGALFAVQAPVNAGLARVLGSPVPAALVSFTVGTLALLAVVLAQGGLPLDALRRAPPHLLLGGGLVGAVCVTLVVVLTPRLGAGTTLALVIAGQLLAALALDHLGALGLAEHAASPGRIAGAALVVAGAVLIRVL